MRRQTKAKTTVESVRRSYLVVLLMSNQSVLEVELLRTTYAAFNARDLDVAIAIMAPDVQWPRAFKGGFVCGPEEVRAYWIEQQSEIDAQVEPVAFHVEKDGRILVDVHQVVRDLSGTTLADEHVGHRYTIEDGLIKAMELCQLKV